MDAQALLALLKDGGLITILFFILFGSYKQVWVWGDQYRKVETEKEEWKHMALKGTNIAERAVDLARK